MKTAWIAGLLLVAACSSGDDTSDDDTQIARDAGFDPDRDGGPAPTLADLSDTFEGGALDSSWSTLQDGNLAVAVEGGALAMTVTKHALWFNESAGTLIHKPVTGDFKVTAPVHARMASDPTMPPDRFVHLGGLMARDGTSASENYVFIVLGWDEQDLSIETKSTDDDVSNYVGPAWPSGDAELRLCRVGSTFVVLKRMIGAASWEVAETYERPDLPATLQVGPNAYAYADPGITPDLTVRFDEVRFAEVSARADCEAD